MTIKSLMAHTSPFSEAVASPAVHIASSSVSRLLDDTYYRLNADDISTMDAFVETLNDVRCSLNPSAWNALIADAIAPHPIRHRLHEEPFTRRAFEKPRGYPGDAPLLDLVYRDEPTTEFLTPLGARLHAWAGQHSGCRSVRERRTILAALIDRVAGETRRPRILSLACGHLREAHVAESVRDGRIGEFFGIDQDAETLALVERELGTSRVTPVRMTIRRFLGAPTALGTFNLAYAAGLYDYLVPDIAAAVTRAMFAALQPGGTLLVGNFAPELPEIGYMEAIMDWRLIYRTEAEVERFVASIDRDAIVESSIARDTGGNVVYLTVRKA
jgi:extracellular factor (EF) 3-hydroxypalmitic acid methyl ester biosynthesis protein